MSAGRRGGTKMEWLTSAFNQARGCLYHVAHPPGLALSSYADDPVRGSGCPEYPTMPFPDPARKIWLPGFANRRLQLCRRAAQSGRTQPARRNGR